MNTTKYFTKPKDFAKFIEKTRGIDLREILSFQDHLSALVRGGFSKDEYQYLNTLRKMAKYTGWVYMQLCIDVPFRLEHLVPGSGKYKQFHFRDGIYSWRSCDLDHHKGDVCDLQTGILKDLEACTALWSNLEFKLAHEAEAKAKKELQQYILQKFIRERVIDG